MLRTVLINMNDMEGMSRSNSQEGNEQAQQELAREYLALNTERETISAETMNLLKNLDSARDEVALAGDFGKTEVERLDMAFKESYAKEKEIMEKMKSISSQMTEAAKQKYLRPE